MRSMNQKRLMIIYISGILLCLLAFYRTEVLINLGIISVENTGRDIGYYKLGSVVRHNFTIRNYSLRSAAIYTYRPLCTCTVAAIERRVIPPFGSSNISLTVDTKTLHSGKNLAGVTLLFADGRSIFPRVTFNLIESPNGKIRKSLNKR